MKYSEILENWLEKAWKKHKKRKPYPEPGWGVRLEWLGEILPWLKKLESEMQDVLDFVKYDFYLSEDLMKALRKAGVEFYKDDDVRFKNRPRYWKGKNELTQRADNEQTSDA